MQKTRGRAFYNWYYKRRNSEGRKFFPSLHYTATPAPSDYLLNEFLAKKGEKNI